MIIQADLTEEEEEALCFLLGLATGQAVRLDQKLTINAVRITNKLLANSPNFVPYDEKSFDPSIMGFPFRRQKTQ